MADLFENPMGLMGFEFVEFASPTANLLEPVFEMMGFTRDGNYADEATRLRMQARYARHDLEREELGTGIDGDATPGVYG